MGFARVECLSCKFAWLARDTWPPSGPTRAIPLCGECHHDFTRCCAVVTGIYPKRWTFIGDWSPEVLVFFDEWLARRV